MGEPIQGGDGASAAVISEEKESKKHMSLFQRLFAPESLETDVSGDSDSGSLDSATHFTDDASGSDEENDESTGEPSTSSSAIKFDRELRARHRGACKNMTVRKTFFGTLSPRGTGGGI
jgi:hypothetical protein